MLPTKHCKASFFPLKLDWIFSQLKRGAGKARFKSSGWKHLKRNSFKSSPILRCFFPNLRSYGIKELNKTTPAHIHPFNRVNTQIKRNSDESSNNWIFPRGYESTKSGKNLRKSQHDRTLYNADHIYILLYVIRCQRKCQGASKNAEQIGVNLTKYRTKFYRVQDFYKS